MSRPLTFFSLCLVALSFWTGHAQATEDETVHDIFIHEGLKYQYKGVVHDPESLGALLQPQTASEEEGYHILRLNCVISNDDRALFEELQKWVYAKTVDGDPSAPECSRAVSSLPHSYLRAKIENSIGERSLNEGEQPFVGTWQGVRTKPDGSVDYTWRVLRSDQGLFHVTFYQDDSYSEEMILYQTNGFWWIENELFHELQDHRMISLPDVYSFEIQGDQIIFSSPYTSYDFVDHRIEN